MAELCEAEEKTVQRAGMSVTAWSLGAVQDARLQKLLGVGPHTLILTVNKEFAEVAEGPY